MSQDGTRNISSNGWVPDAASFGARLALIRQRMGWGNIAEAARACGVPVETWRSWESANSTPRDVLTMARQIADATGCSYFWLLTGEVNTSPTTAVAS